MERLKEITNYPGGLGMIRAICYYYYKVHLVHCTYISIEEHAYVIKSDTVSTPVSGKLRITIEGDAQSEWQQLDDCERAYKIYGKNIMGAIKCSMKIMNNGLVVAYDS